jgi:hypothetical protein
MVALRYSMIIFLALSISFVPNAISQSYSSSWIDGTPSLYDEAQNLLKMTGVSNKPILAPPLVVVENKPVYDVGEAKKFFAINMQNNRQYSLNSSLYAVNDKAYVFVEDGNNVPLDKINNLLASFDGIYGSLTKQFGQPPNNINNDPRVYLLIMNIAGGALPNGVRILGYFSPIDQFRNADIAKLTNKRSNELNMLYIDSISLTSNRIDIKSVVAHELTHLIQWGKDPEESMWVDEGLAVYAESFLGYNVSDRISAFEKNPDISLRDWNNTVEDYGAAYLFFAYISERFGGVDTVAAIMKDNKQDTVGIERALAQLGKSITFTDIFSDWVIANYLDDPKIYDGKYGYSTLDIKLNPSTVETQYPIIQKAGQVLPWSAKYTELQKGNTNQLKLTVFDDGQNYINACVISKSGEGKVEILPVISVKDKSGNATVPVEGLEVIMVVTSQPDPPDIKQDSAVYTYSAEIGTASISVTPLGNKITTWGSIKQN